MNDEEKFAQPLFRQGVQDFLGNRESAIGVMHCNEDRESAMIYLAGWIRGTNMKMKQIRDKMNGNV